MINILFLSLYDSLKYALFVSALSLTVSKLIYLFLSCLLVNTLSLLPLPKSKETTRRTPEPTLNLEQERSRSEPGEGKK